MSIMLGSQRDAQGFLKRFRTASEAGVAVKPDWWPYCKFLSHLDGADGATSATDESDSSRSISFSGNAQLDTALYKFGTASALFDGVGDYIGLGYDAGLAFAGGDFTIDFWFYPTDANRRAIFASTTDQRIGIDYHINGTRNIGIWASSTGSSWNLLNADAGGNGIGAISLTLNTWNHVAYVRNGDNWMSFVNGVKDVDVTVAGSIIATSESWNIGRWGGDLVSKLLGSIDEFRILKGYAAWTADFTPPTKAYLS